MKRTTAIAGLLIASTLALVSPDPAAQEEGDNYAIEDGLAADTQTYADNMGVSIDEAIRRFRLQDLAGELEAELSTNFPETFAGLWLEHEPQFRIVVSFTRNAQASLAPYVRPGSALEGHVEARSAEASLARLQHEQAQVTASSRRAGIPVESEINVQENRVELYVVDRDRFDAAVGHGEIRLPPRARITTTLGLSRPLAGTSTAD